MKQYNLEMYLLSESGYSMPFDDKMQEPELLLDYGMQQHPRKDYMFFHGGIDIKTEGVTLKALASGKVVGTGIDERRRAHFIIIRYGEYDVEYIHLDKVYVGSGSYVSAGDEVAKSGVMTHIGVRYRGEVISPKDFLLMIYNNCEASRIMREKAIKNVKAQDKAKDAKEKTSEKDYDPSAFKTSGGEYSMDMEDIIRLMTRYLPLYMQEIRDGSYKADKDTEGRLRDILHNAAEEKYYFEQIPSINNPLGLSSRSLPLAEKIQDLIIGDFLNYLAVRQSMFLPSWDECKKKLSFRMHLMTVG